MCARSRPSNRFSALEDRESEEGEAIPYQAEEEAEVQELRINLAFQEFLRAMDHVDLETVFRRRRSVMKSVPWCVKGPFTNAMEAILEEIMEIHETGEIQRQDRGWKVFFPLLRTLLHGRCRAGPTSKWKESFEALGCEGRGSKTT